MTPESINKKFSTSLAYERMKTLEASGILLDGQVNFELSKWEALPKPLSSEMQARYKKIESWKYAFDALKQDYADFVSNLEEDPSNDEKLDSFENRFQEIRGEWNSLPLLEVPKLGAPPPKPFPWTAVGWSLAFVGVGTAFMMYHSSSQPKALPARRMS